ncbi:extracellular solute-binding protein [Paenibacillus sp. GCM10027626]|uniref:extracellular solute-binding protein n=1 Tax=Paenibacillus sp. GCM10027626 TaxID=3273411 RepID=UPI003631DB24
MKRKTEIRKAILIAVMLLLALTAFGCSKNDPPAEKGNGEEGTQTPGNKQVSLTMFQQGINLDNIAGIKNDPVKNFVDNKFNLNLELLTGDMEKIKLLLSTDQSPDIVSLPFWWTGASQLYKDGAKEGMFVDIGDIVAKNPGKYPVLAKLIKDKDFKYFNQQYTGDPNKTYGVWIGSNAINVNGSPLFNMRILNELHLALPTTVDEFIQVLREIKQGKPNMIPFGYLNYKGTNFPLELDQIFFNTNGTTASGMSLNEQGKWVDNAINPENKKIWKLLQDLYKEGLFDKEAFSKDNYYHGTNDFAQQKTAVITTALPNSNDGMYKWMFTEFAKANPGATSKDVQLLPHPLTGPGGQEVVEASAFNINDVIFIPKSSKDPERALAFVEWALSSEGQASKYYGIEGVHHTKDAAGNRQLIDPSEWKKVTDVWNMNGEHGLMYGLTYSADNGMFDYEKYGWMEAHKNAVRNIIPERAGITEESTYAKGIIATWQKEVYKELPFYYNTPSLSDESKKIETKLKDIRDKYFVKFFVGELDVNGNWDKFVQEYTNAGLDKYIADYTKVTQEAKQAYEAIK